MGYGLYAMLNMNSDEINLALLLVCLALVGAVCCLAAEMVIRKSFRIFRKGWKSAAAVALVLIAICVCAKLDVFGYHQRGDQLQPRGYLCQRVCGRGDHRGHPDAA